MLPAKRARDINANGLPIAPFKHCKIKRRKPVAVATQELVEGKLHFERSDGSKHTAQNTPSIFTDSQDSDDGSDIFDEELLALRRRC